MSGPDQNPNYFTERNYWCTIFIIYILFLSIVSFFKKWLFLLAGENLTFSVRVQLYESLLYKQVAWFDRKERAPGIITNILSEDITNLNGLTTETIAAIVETLFVITIGTLISAYFDYRVCLVAIGFTPFVIAGSLITNRLQWKVK